ncbi:GNAT family N-acetyltransferase [Alienimonas californiensis]|uniref:Mycothiol acetyltransferase n=1 Tax=Alienimonas californiensis TaxID=2527989 RepID=A0A517P8E1_9PLAN|nr:GNAT family N-acetyltransferase [Alienimonas californiensis]QDT15648.1 Mycothiol acetyltransferase [Alienimonas californiensis]
MPLTLRRFRNGDPPALVRLWNAAGLGRGAVQGLTIDVFDHLVLAQQHFDPRGLIVAVETADGADADPGGNVPRRHGRTVGFALSGLLPQRPGTEECVGAVDAVLVHPDARGRGVGRRLMAAAVESLRQRGASRILAGGGPAESPFLVGLYGGSAPAGFLDSDPAARPFATACGFRERGRTVILQRPTDLRERAGFQVLAARRHAALRTAPPLESNRWWATRFGRLDTLRFELAARGRDASPGPATAGVTLVGLDLYGPAWDRRAVGLRDLATGPGGGQPHLHALILETTRRLREEAVDLLEIHADAADAAALALLSRIGFSPIDQGTRFELAED